MTMFKIWLLNLMLTFSPVVTTAKHQAFPGWEETPEQRTERYESIAQDVVEVVWALNPDGTSYKHESAFTGPQGRVQTAALILAIAWHESGFAPDVDKGPCYMGKYGKNGRCDGGRSACMLQIMVGREYVTRDGKKIEPRTRDGWTRADLFADRKKCIVSGLTLMRNSMKTCSRAKVHPDHRLAAYGSGNCERAAGLRGSERLFGLYRRFWTRLEPPKGLLPTELADATPELLTQQPGS